MCFCKRLKQYLVYCGWIVSAPKQFQIPVLQFFTETKCQLLPVIDFSIGLIGVWVFYTALQICHILFSFSHESP